MSKCEQRNTILSNMKVLQKKISTNCEAINIYRNNCLYRYTIVTAAYLVFWGPLFLVTLVHWRMEWTEARSSVTHQVLDDHSDGDDDEDDDDNDNYDENGDYGDKHTGCACRNHFGMLP